MENKIHNGLFFWGIDIIKHIIYNISMLLIKNIYSK